MVRLLCALWADDRGAILATEYTFSLTILTLGTVTGLVAMRQAVVSEMTEIAQAILALDQSYSFNGSSNCAASTAGSSASDSTNTIQAASTQPTFGLVDQPPCD